MNSLAFMTSKDDFLNWLTLRMYSTNTKKNYLYYYTVLKRTVGEPLNEKKIAQFLLIKNNGMRRSFLRAYLSFTKQKELLDHIPKIRGRSKKRLPNYLTKTEIELITKDLEPKLRCLCKLMYECGLRVSEGLSIKRKNLDFRAHTVSGFGKGNKEFKRRFTPRTAWLLDAIFSKLEPNDFLFPYTRQAVWYRINREGYKVLRKRVHPHVFRHSIATEMQSIGIPTNTIKEFMRHSDISSTAVYAHVVEADVNKAFDTTFNLDEEAKK